VLDTEQGRFFPSKKFNMAEDFDVEAMLEAKAAFRPLDRRRRLRVLLELQVREIVALNKKWRKLRLWVKLKLLAKTK